MKLSVCIPMYNESRVIAETASTLSSYLSSHFEDYELLFSDDGSTDGSAELVRRLALPNTRVVGYAQNRGKGCAVRTAMLEATGDYILFTDADCRPASKLWISTMVRNFTPGVRIVLGYGAYESKKGLVSYAISYDTVTIAMQYLSCAVSGMPYMGVGRNLAYRKSFFLSTKGFSSHLDLQSGDDDLFVNEYAEAGNTKVEISPLSVTVSGPKSTIWQWFVQKQRHLTTSVRYKPSSKAVLGCEMF